LPGKFTGVEKRQVTEKSLTKEDTMKRTKFLAGTFAVLLFIPAGAQAQVKSIGMKLGGHLCSMCSFSIRKAVSLLDFGPKPEEVKITDFNQGLSEFKPKSEKPVRFADLKATLKRAGFKLISAEIAVSGKLTRDDSGWWIEAGVSGQRFELDGDELNPGGQTGATAGDFEAIGDWQTGGKRCEQCEVIRLRSGKREVSRSETGYVPFPDANPIRGPFVEVDAAAGAPPAPIWTTTPSLAVYKGGEVTLRYHFTQQHLGALRVDHHEARLGFSYTPTPRLQFEGEVPYHIYDQGSSSAHNSGNVIAWVKYRFYNSLETGGDRQAAIRVGLELPTASKDVVSDPATNGDEFLRRQLLRIDGGLSTHVDAAYSRAKRRFVYGANVEGVMRSEFVGVRMGNEVRLNTDLEYILLPVEYRGPTNELRLILETNYLHKARGRIRGNVVPGSSASEYYVAPAIQFAFNPRWVIEGSYQLPVALNTGPRLLRTDRSVMFGVRFMY
jgi:hypothetical protein